jgi:hypothetical protein
MYGPVVFSGTAGDTSYYRHVVKYNDIENMMNPYISIVQSGRLVNHARLNEVVDYLSDVEAKSRLQQSVLLAIDAYGVTLGDNILSYDGFSMQSTDADARLILYTDKSMRTGWDVVAVKATVGGVIEEIDVLRRFESSSALSLFARQMRDSLSKKFVPADLDVGPDSGLLEIYGVPNESAYRSTLRQIVLNTLQMPTYSNQGLRFVPYVVNPILGRIMFVYSLEGMMAMLQIQSNRIDWRIEKTAGDLLDRL